MVWGILYVIYLGNPWYEASHQSVKCTNLSPSFKVTIFKGFHMTQLLICTCFFLRSLCQRRSQRMLKRWDDHCINVYVHWFSVVLNHCWVYSQVVVWKRYSELKKLHGELAYTHRNLFRRQEEFPPFPRAQVFGKTKRTQKDRLENCWDGKGIIKQKRKCVYYKEQFDILWF